MKRIVMIAAMGLLGGLALQTAKAAEGLTVKNAVSPPPSSPQGRVTAREYNDANPTDGNTISELTDCVRYPEDPDEVFYPVQWEWPSMNRDEDSTDAPAADSGKNEYAWEIRGYFYPQETGPHFFAISTDDPGELWLSTDDDFGNLQMIASEPNWNGVRAFAGEDRRTLVDEGTADERFINRSKGIQLQAGKAYAMMSRAVEGQGGDNMAVAFNTEGFEFFEDGNEPIPGSMLSTFDLETLASPRFKTFAGSPTGFSFSLTDGEGAGARQVDESSISATLDGATITVNASKDGAITSGEAAIAVGFLESGSQHTAVIKFKDSSGIESEITKSYNVSLFATIPASAKIENYKGTKRGFKMRVLQADTGLANSVSLREQHLAGTLTDANGDPLENIADDFFFDKDGTVTVDLINFDQDGNPQGVFRDSGAGDATDVPDDFIPGIPGLDGGTDNITAEIFTVVEIPKAGLMRFAFNSDDGFKTTGGNTGDVFDSLVLGIFDGGRGAATTFYDVVFEEPGFYKLRSIWFEGGGGANLEWWTADGTDPIALLNDDANGGLKTWGEPIPADPAAVKGISPSNGQGEISAEGTQISVTIQDGSTTVDTGSISMTFDGSPVTPKVNSSGGTTTITFDTGPLAGNTTFNWSLSFKAGTLDRTVAASFRTTVLAGDGLLFIETEDFDFGKGNWDKSNPIGFTGQYPGGTYQDKGDGIDETDANAGTDFGVDYFEVDNSNSQAIYRPDTGVEAGKMNGPAGFFRGTFDVETNHVTGWNDAGDWYNYTRTFPDPARKYNVFGRLASGGAAIQASLSKVTSGVGTTTQEVEPLGIWTPGRATAGWDSFEIFPLLAPDAAPGDAGPPAVVELGGTTTLRLTTLPGAHDSDFIVFLPAKEEAAPGEITKVSLEGGNIVIEFAGTLESADAVTGPFSPVTGASSPFSVAPQGAAKFYIAR